MIKAQTNGGHMILGLSDENVKRLTSNQPIKFDLGEIYPNVPEMQGKFGYIFHGKNETEMMKVLPLGPDTKINM